MYYIEKENKIVLFDEDKAKIENTLIFMPDLQGAEILETNKKIVIFENEFYFADDEEYIEKSNEAEAERIAMLYLTAADVERGIYKAKGLDFDDILEVLSSNPQEGLDLKALKIELKANHFYRGNPYVSAIGQLLGFTAEQLNKFFEDGNYEHLLVKTDEELPTDETVLPEEPTNEDITNE